MAQQDPHSPPPGEPDEYGQRPPRQDVVMAVAIGAATLLAYVAQPVTALVWAGAAIAGAVVHLSQGRSLRAPVIVALVLAVVALLWMLVQLGALY